MSSNNLDEEQKDRLLDEFDNQVRELELEKVYKDLPKSEGGDRAVALMVGARIDSGMGSHLQNVCPYFRSCEEKNDSTICVGKENYRKNDHCYGLKKVGDLFSGKINLERLI